MFVVASAICFALGELNIFLQEAWANRVELAHFNVRFQFILLGSLLVYGLAVAKQKSWVTNDCVDEETTMNDPTAATEFQEEAGKKQLQQKEYSLV
jgi:hypothetical protein